MVDARFPEKWLTDRRLMRLSPSAFRSFTVSLAWAVSNRTEGVIHSNDWPTIPGFMPIDVAELVSSDLWTELDGGWEIAVFSDSQTSKSELEALENIRRTAREKKARQRLEARAVDGVPGTRPGDGPGGPHRPGQALRGQEEPPLFCTEHPRGTEDPCRACMDARRLHEAWDRARRAQPTSTPRRTDPATCAHRLHPVDPVCLRCDTVFGAGDPIYVQLRLDRLDVAHADR